MVTKQQKIQAGVAQLLFDWLDCKGMDCIDNDDAARRILSYLDKEGVVIKVERELPKAPDMVLQDGIRSQVSAKMYVNAGISVLLNDGYVATIPIIET